MSATSPIVLIPDPLDQLLNMHQMQALLGFKSRNAVDAAETAGVIPKSFKLSGSRRWRLSAVRAAIAALEQAANTPDAALA
jgi:predicted DNA-binding transcriptional regulator AlpA